MVDLDSLFHNLCAQKTPFGNTPECSSEMRFASGIAPLCFTALFRLNTQALSPFENTLAHFP